MKLERGRRQSLQGLVEQRWASVFNLEKWGDTDGLNWAGGGGRVGAFGFTFQEDPWICCGGNGWEGPEWQPRVQEEAALVV